MWYVPYIDVRDSECLAQQKCGKRIVDKLLNALTSYGAFFEDHAF
jgi:hypothetical protein